MSSLGALPPLAAMYLTTGHRVPDEVLALLAPPDAAHPLGGWECPLGEARRCGERAADRNQTRVPGY